MTSFAELVNQLDNLSKEEVEELKRIIEMKWIEIRRQEILDAAEEARRERAEGNNNALFARRN